MFVGLSLDVTLYKLCAVYMFNSYFYFCTFVCTVQTIIFKNAFEYLLHKVASVHLFILKVFQKVFYSILCSPSVYNNVMQNFYYI